MNCNLGLSVLGVCMVLSAFVIFAPLTLLEIVRAVAMYVAMVIVVIVFGGLSFIVLFAGSAVKEDDNGS